jgi:glycosyltransferase involved in cell wall biosynthesis
MNVLNINASLDPVSGGGTGERTFQMSKFLALAGINCTILTLDLGLSESRLKSLNGVRVVALPCINKRFYVPRFSFKMISNIKAAMKKSDVLHIMGHWTIINALAYYAARWFKKPYIVCPAGALPAFGRSKILKKLYNILVGYNLIRNATYCIAVTADEIPQFEEYGIKRAKVIVIPNGINREQYLNDDTKTFRDKHSLGTHPFILFVGRLNPIKGPDLLLRAFCKGGDALKDYHLVFAGPDENMLLGLREFADINKIAQRVHFVGYIEGEEKSQAYHAATLLVIPSRKEAMSIVVLEAGMAGTPVLITDQCGFSVVESIKGGKVVPASVECLQAGMIDILSDKGRLKAMGSNLNRFVEKKYQWNAVIKEYIQLYDQILKIAR